MKRIFALILAAHMLAPASAAEPPRGSVHPYATVGEAVAASDGASRYITPLGDWIRSESNGRTVFTTSFVYPASWLNRQILLRVESASAGYSVTVGGRPAGSAVSGASASEFNITKLAVQGVNEIGVTLNGSADDSPLMKSGDVRLGRVEVLSQPTIRVRDAEWRTTLDESGNGTLEVALAVKCDALNPKQSRISYELTAPDDSRLAYGYRDIVLDMRREDTVRFVAKVPREWLWSADSPSMLRLTLRNRIDGRYDENIVLPVGARDVGCSDGVLTVNGVPVPLRVAVVNSDASPAELSALKSEGYNAVTYRAGESADRLLDACDSAGLYIIPQVAVDTSAGGPSLQRGGNPGNDPSLTEEMLDRVQMLYHTAKRHPSAVVWSLGSGAVNGINFYEAYLLMKRLDGRRPVIYDGAGREWNSDRVDMQIAAPAR